jgi:hypothetical protein
MNNNPQAPASVTSYSTEKGRKCRAAISFHNAVRRDGRRWRVPRHDDLGSVQAQYGGSGGPNVWKSTAYYRDYPNGPQFCGRCVHFRPPAACQIVEPPISPSGWCRFFYPQPVVLYRRGAPVGPGY